MIDNLTDVLADPVDGTALTLDAPGGPLRSAAGRTFDIAGTGYAVLTPAGLDESLGDSEDMVTARETFLSRGHFAPFVEAVTASVVQALDDADVPDDQQVTILDAGAGTGFYLSHTLDQVEQARGVGIDVSTDAANLLAQAHPRVGALVADLAGRLPVRDASVDVITSVFAPVNFPEFARALPVGGRLIVLTPAPGHLDELRAPLGIDLVDAAQAEEIRQAAGRFFAEVGQPRDIVFPMTLDQESIANQVAMSPSARAINPDELHERLDRLADQMTITAHGLLLTLRRR